MRVLEIVEPVRRLHVYCSALMRGVDDVMALLSRSDIGFTLQGEEGRSDIDNALGKLQSIADTFMVLYDDTHPTYLCASQISELLALMAASESRWVMLMKEPGKRMRWKKSAIDGWPFFWALIAGLATEFVRLSKLPAFDFETADGLIWLQDTSNTESPDFCWSLKDHSRAFY